MTTFADINGKRVDKMLETLKLIAKSAKSNKATDQEIVDLLAPLAVEIEFAKPTETEPPAPKSVPGQETNSFPSGTHPILQHAKTADLEVATTALYIIAARIEDELWERRNKGDSPSS